MDGRDEASRLNAGQHIPGQCEWRWDGVSGESGTVPQWAAMSARAELVDISASPPRNSDHLATDQVSGDPRLGHSPDPPVPPVRTDDPPACSDPHIPHRGADHMAPTERLAPAFPGRLPFRAAVSSRARRRPADRSGPATASSRVTTKASVSGSKRIRTTRWVRS